MPTAAVDETIEVVGSNPAGGMGEKSDNDHCQNSEGKKVTMTIVKIPRAKKVTMIIDKILRVAIVTSINLKSSRGSGEVPNEEVPQPLRLTSHLKAHKNTSIL